MYQLDQTLFQILNGLAGKSKLSDLIFVFFADYLQYFLLLAFAAFLFKISKELRLRLLVTTAVSSLASRFIVTEIIRVFYHRPRPFSVWHVTQLISENKWSFPSGHATFFFAIATSVYFYNKKWGIAFFIMAILMGVGRIISGVHYPTDILGGIIIGIVVAYLVFFVVRRIKIRSGLPF